MTQTPETSLDTVSRDAAYQKAAVVKDSSSRPPPHNGRMKGPSLRRLPWARSDCFTRRASNFARLPRRQRHEIRCKMPSHWTYSQFEQGSDLLQGDLVRRSNALLAVLGEVHKFFCDPRYTAFAVLTQSCDLVRRAGVCKSEHINLAVVRELETLLPRLLRESCATGVDNVFRREGRYYAQQILQKILNQNDQARGLFYLHPDADAGIATPSVIMLRVSIALRRQHYDLLKESRCGRLAPQYANKLGWLSGNLYSRIATPDWEDQVGDKEASAKQAKSLLARITQPNDGNWVPQEWVESASKAELTWLLSRQASSPRPFGSTLLPSQSTSCLIVSARSRGRWRQPTLRPESRSLLMATIIWSRK